VRERGGINDEGTISPDNVSVYADLEKKASSFAARDQRVLFFSPEKRQMAAGKPPI